MPPRSSSSPRTLGHAIWQRPPGSLDALNASRLFQSDNPMGIPALRHTPLSAAPQALVAYRARVRSPRFDASRAAVHFFLDDYRFESVWTYPRRVQTYLQRFSILLTPDFSLYADWPLAMQQWNVYRSRWCGCYWQDLGFQIIPTVSWSTPESFDFCFAGIPPHSLVAVSTLGIPPQKSVEQARFIAGYQEMIRRLQPSTVITYGELPPEVTGCAPVVTYETGWDGHTHVHPRRD